MTYVVREQSELISLYPILSPRGLRTDDRLLASKLVAESE